jgi:hypothetical protein
VGQYAITAANPNYAITANAAALTITSRPISITLDSKTKVYGDRDPGLTYSIVSGALVSGDRLRLTRDAGNDVGSYAISASNANYLVTASAANLVIAPRPITIQIDPRSKFSGERDPVLTYSVVSGRAIGLDRFSLTRAPGEAVGAYEIFATHPNYVITQNSEQLTIAPAVVSPTAALGPGLGQPVGGVGVVAQTTNGMGGALSPMTSQGGFGVGSTLPSPTSLTQPVKLTGGLAFVEVAQNSGTGLAMTSAAQSGSTASAGDTSARGEDSIAIDLPNTQFAGYNTVFVVNGGINIPPQTDFIGE